MKAIVCKQIVNSSKSYFQAFEQKDGLFALFSRRHNLHTARRRSNPRQDILVFCFVALTSPAALLGFTGTLLVMLNTTRVIAPSSKFITRTAICLGTDLPQITLNRLP